jgi:hypothetical protein
MIRCGPDGKKRASQLALEIYAKIPLIPQSLLIRGPNVRIESKYWSNYYNGTLVNGECKSEATFWSWRWGIFVGYPFSLAPRNVR